MMEITIERSPYLVFVLLAGLALCFDPCDYQAEATNPADRKLAGSYETNSFSVRNALRRAAGTKEGISFERMRAVQQIEIEALSGCTSKFKRQRLVERVEYTDYVIKAATIEIIDGAAGNNAIEVSSLKSLFLDSDGDFVEEYSSNFPSYTALPDGSLEKFALYACQYTRDGDDDTAEFCKNDNPTVAFLPSESSIRLASIDDDETKEQVVQDLCNGASSYWGEIVQTVKNYYVGKGLVTEVEQKPPTAMPTTSSPTMMPTTEIPTERPTQRPSSASPTSNPTERPTEAINTDSNGQNNEIGGEQGHDISTSVPTTISTPVPTTSPTAGNDSTVNSDETVSPTPTVSSTPSPTENLATHSVRLPLFILNLHLKSGSSKVDKSALVRETSKILSNSLEQSSSSTYRFKSIILVASLEESRRRVLRRDRSEVVAVIFTGSIEYHGGAPSVGEIRQRIMAAFSGDDYLQALQSSTNEALASVTKVQLLMEEPDSEEGGGEANESSTRGVMNIVTGIVAGIAGLLLLTALLIAMRQRSKRGWRREDAGTLQQPDPRSTDHPSRPPSPPASQVKSAFGENVSGFGAPSQFSARPESSTGSSDGSYSLSAFDGEEPSLTGIIDVNASQRLSRHLASMEHFPNPEPSSLEPSETLSNIINNLETSSISTKSQSKGPSAFSEEEMFDFVNDSVDHYRSKKEQEKRAAKCVFDGVEI